ncbi:M20 peptidase aminoacylase family protein [Halalkalibacter krulwichiae]|uniref:Putative hydrolase YxeP n=1 Tax=Halalkalibacter krulwichiae TaxID=199441 RepID=A0A1X9MFB2_9BACI|nr:M20 peptidase aminoacylase family protein [Halalkalibacter krulwichiae]ARK30211.1 putative hydrolase YxeP [Halalkalibacter krulwichiae]
MRTIKNIDEWIEKYKDQITATYQHLHSIAEVSWEEQETTNYLAKRVGQLGIEYSLFDDHTGLVAEWKGDSHGPTVALRADIDALWQNVNGVWKANHSCGHDGHATMVLYTLKMLMDIGYKPKGTLKIIFQPAEETGTGAKKFIDKGVVNDVSYLLGIHVRPSEELSLKEASPAIYHGATKILQGKVKGVQAHAARPHQGINVIDSIGAIINAVNSIKIDPRISSSAKVTMVRTEGRNYNIIPDEAIIGIDLRAQTNEAMETLFAQVQKAVMTAASFNGAEIELETLTSMVAAVPNKTMEQIIQKAIEEVLGKESVSPPLVTPGGEDFHYYAARNPNLKATMVGLGADLSPGLHHPNMSFNVTALLDGVKILAVSIMKLFEQPRSDSK